MTEDTVVVRLSYDEALVLFEWLSAMEERDSCAFAHPAEERVLWKIEGVLERSLLAPLQPDYDALLQQARERVAGGREDRNLEEVLLLLRSKGCSILESIMILVRIQGISPAAAKSIVALSETWSDQREYNERLHEMAEEVARKWAAGEME